MNSLRSSAIAFTAIIVGLLTAPNAALAQPKPGYSPSSTHIFPAGGRRGTKVKVNVGAECIPPGTRFYLSGPGPYVYFVSRFARVTFYDSVKLIRHTIHYDLRSKRALLNQ